MKYWKTLAIFCLFALALSACGEPTTQDDTTTVFGPMAVPNDNDSGIQFVYKSEGDLETSGGGSENPADMLMALRFIAESESGDVSEQRFEKHPDGTFSGRMRLAPGWWNIEVEGYGDCQYYYLENCTMLFSTTFPTIVLVERGRYEWVEITLYETITGIVAFEIVTCLNTDLHGGLQHTLDIAQPGRDCVYVTDGLYYGNFTSKPGLSLYGSGSKYTTLVGEDASLPVLTIPDAPARGSNEPLPEGWVVFFQVEQESTVPAIRVGTNQQVGLMELLIFAHDGMELAGNEACYFISQVDFVHTPMGKDPTGVRFLAEPHWLLVASNIFYGGTFGLVLPKGDDGLVVGHVTNNDYWPTENYIGQFGDYDFSVDPEFDEYYRTGSHLLDEEYVGMKRIGNHPYSEYQYEY